jgi:hypothetical protein
VGSTTDMEALAVVNKTLLARVRGVKFQKLADSKEVKCER